MNLKKIFKKIFNLGKKDNIFCPICGYYCLGKGGFDCINKPKLLKK
jgi:hypothetical protein